MRASSAFFALASQSLFWVKYFFVKLDRVAAASSIGTSPWGRIPRVVLRMAAHAHSLRFDDDGAFAGRQRSTACLVVRQTASTSLPSTI